VLLATATPLASIFGSGFLIIVPIQVAAVGPWAVFGMAAVCLIAWFVGNAIRHNVKIIEPAEESGKLSTAVGRLEYASHAAIIVAYVISVALYLRILAQFVVGYLDPGSPNIEVYVALGCIALITIVGLVRGLDGLDAMERWSLGVVMLLVVLIVGVFAVKDIGRIFGAGLEFPPTPDGSVTSALAILGGIVITVQGFETIRYLPHIDAEIRIAGSRLAQLIATVTYLLIVGLATPLMADAVAAGKDETLLQLVQLAAPLLALPLVITAAGSQFSAAVADTEASVGNIRSLKLHRLKGRRSYLVIGVAASILVLTLDTFTIVVVASRAFAAYYALQCVVAARTSNGLSRGGYLVLAALMAAIAAFATPVG
jgi:hypothetical protein